MGGHGLNKGPLRGVGLFNSLGGDKSDNNNTQSIFPSELWTTQFFLTGMTTTAYLLLSAVFQGLKGKTGINTLLNTSN